MRNLREFRAKDYKYVTGPFARWTHLDIA